MYAQLGDYIFQDYKGFKELGTSDEVVLSEHPLIEGKPRLQATGFKLREIAIKFLLHSTFSNPESDVAILQGYKNRVEVLPFLSGSGNSFGNFVIKKIETSLVQTDKKGAVISNEITLELLEVVTSGNEKSADLLAVKVPGIVIPSRAPRPTDPQIMSLNLRAITTNTNAIVKDLTFAEKVGTSAARAFRTAKNRVGNIRTALANLEKLGNQTQKIFGYYTNAKGQINQVSNSTESLAIFLADGDLNSSINASTQLRNSVTKLNVDAAPINNLTTLRLDQEPLAGDNFDYILDLNLV